MDERMKYCPACGEEVETFKMMNFDFDDPAEVDCCGICGLELGNGETAPPLLKTVIVAEDSEMMRALITDVMTDQRLAEEVVACRQGAEFITRSLEMAIASQSPSLVILDVSMPVLNGVNAAVALRAAERAFGGGQTPILFFTAHRCDDNLKKVMEYCKPAFYLNKGADSTPAKLAERIRRVIINIGEALARQDPSGKAVRKA